AATAHIYGPHRADWDGQFRIAIATAHQERAALEAAGYAPLAPGVLIALAPAQAVPGREVIHLRASTDTESAHRLAAQVWAEARLAAGYRRFIATFSELETALDQGTTLSDLEALIARVLLIHQYRRVVLRDPMLPTELLSADWPGHAARGLCARLYGTLVPGSERWLDRNALDEQGRLPPPEPDFWARFQS
ncbi:MAG: phenylacetic acid degradation operon negative regulatory protein PaaX, partial [Alphaproteobacteria bacterium]|nr:phenylacetic acid degradation operon negative regulatory protein PaaX [Alphaproteobacteria bacterium]